jgi:hypothetical protein
MNAKYFLILLTVVPLAAVEKSSMVNVSKDVFTGIVLGVAHGAMNKGIAVGCNCIMGSSDESLLDTSLSYSCYGCTNYFFFKKGETGIEALMHGIAQGVVENSTIERGRFNPGITWNCRLLMAAAPLLVKAGPGLSVSMTRDKFAITMTFGQE